MAAVARAHDRVRASFALAIGAAVVLAGALGRLVGGTTWPAELVVAASALVVVALLAQAVVWPRRGQRLSLGAAPVAALLGVVMAVWALVEPTLGPMLWPSAVAAAGGSTTLVAFARWALAMGAHLAPPVSLDPSHRYAIARPADGKTRMSPASGIQAGDRVEVPAGQRIPTDGVVVEGDGFADERALTAAELAVSKSPGDAVLAGTTTDVPVLAYTAATTQSASLTLRLHEHAVLLLRSIAHAGEAAGGRPVAYLVLLSALALALGILAFPPLGTPLVALLPAAAGALLALGASVPLIAPRIALAHAAVRALRYGVVARDPAALAALGRVARWQADARVLAPTGRLDVLGEADPLLPIAAALLAAGEGPDVQVVQAEVKRRGLRIPVAAAVRRSNGAWHGTVQGARWCVGPRRAVLEEARVELPHDLEASVGFLEERSATTWLVARTDHEVIGAFGVILEPEPDLARVAQALRATVMPGPTDAVRDAIAAAARIERDGPPLRARDASLLARGSPRPSTGLQVELRAPHPSITFDAMVTCFDASVVHLPAVIDELRALRHRARKAAALGLVVPLVIAAPLVALGALDPVLGTLAGVIGSVIATSARPRPARAAAAPPSASRSR